MTVLMKAWFHCVRLEPECINKPQPIFTGYTVHGILHNEPLAFRLLIKQDIKQNAALTDYVALNGRDLDGIITNTLCVTGVLRQQMSLALGVHLVSSSGWPGVKEDIQGGVSHAWSQGGDAGCCKSCLESGRTYRVV